MTELDDFCLCAKGAGSAFVEGRAIAPGGRITVVPGVAEAV